MYDKLSNYILISVIVLGLNLWYLWYILISQICDSTLQILTIQNGAYKNLPKSDLNLTFSTTIGVTPQALIWLVYEEEKMLSKMEPWKCFQVKIHI